jgi:GNAT superfamily N-acetyltransferase
MTIRTATALDQAALFDLIRSFPSPPTRTPDGYADALRIKLSDQSYATLVAEDKDRLIGYLAGYAHRTFYAGGSIAWVDEIWVEPDYRGQGTGRLLMDAFEGWASRQGCLQVSLATSGAAAFYERLGYASSAGYFKKYLNGGSVA